MKIFEKDGNRIVVKADADTSGQFEGYVDQGLNISGLGKNNRLLRDHMLTQTDVYALADLSLIHI